MNIGNIWTKDEEMQLYEEIADNKTIQEISKIHGRTVKAIEMRIDFIIRKKHEENYTINSLSKLFNKTEQEIKSILQKEPKKLDPLNEKLIQIEEKINSIEKMLIKIYKKMKN